MAIFLLGMVCILGIITEVSAQAGTPCAPAAVDTCPSGYYCQKQSSGLFTCQKRKCFPGDALVTMFNGEVKTMKELKIGDKVAAGKDLYSEVYAFGHKEADALAEFLQVTTSANTLELTNGHFVPVNIQGKIVYRRANDLKVGDILLTAYGLSSIKEISNVEKLGLYNPLTLSGNILVNDVVASVHSEWFLDSIFDALGASQYLPYAYQLVLSPIRALYYAAGNQLYSSGYTLLNSYINIADVGLKYGGNIALTVGLGAVLWAAKAVN